MTVTFFITTWPWPFDLRVNATGETEPEETFTHSHLSWSSTILSRFSFLHLGLLQSVASFLLNLCAFCTTSLHALFGLPLGLEPSSSYSIHFFTHSFSSLSSTCPYHRNGFCCSTEIMSSIPTLSSLHPPDHSHLCQHNILITVNFLSCCNWYFAIWSTYVLIALMHATTLFAHNNRYVITENILVVLQHSGNVLLLCTSTSS